LVLDYKKKAKIKLGTLQKKIDQLTEDSLQKDKIIQESQEKLASIQQNESQASDSEQSPNDHEQIEALQDKINQLRVIQYLSYFFSLS